MEDIGTFVLVRGGEPECTIAISGEEGEGTRHAVEILRDKIEEISGVRVKVTSGSDEKSGGRVLVGTLGASEEIRGILEADGILGASGDLVLLKSSTASTHTLLTEDLGDQGFVLHSALKDSRPHLVLAADTDQGLLYCVNTIVDRLHRRGGSLVVSDLGTRLNPTLNVPSFEYRSIATNISGPDWLGHNLWEKDWGVEGGYDYRGFIDWVAERKVNNLNLWIFDLAFGIAYDSKRYPEAVNRHHPNVKNEFMGDLIDYAHKRYISIYLFVDFPDNWTAVVKAHPELAAANVNPADIPDGDAWELYQRSGEGKYLSRGERLRGKCSWVCASKPETMEFWRGYWDELLDRYPNVDGIGGQFCEHHKTRCSCPNCSEHFFELQWKFFEEMAKIGRAKNPRMKFWAYRSWGARDILANRGKLPNLTWIDWGSSFQPFLMRRSLPRGDWYLYHCGDIEWPEYGESVCCKIFPRLNLEGYQRRAVFYRDRENIYQAFKEFTWNPDLSAEEYAYLYTLGEFRREEPQVAEAYANWIRATGLMELLNYGKSPPTWTAREGYKEELKNHLERLEQLLGDIKVESPFVERLRRSFDEEKDGMYEQ